jgi:hypothetical protein
MIAYLYGFELAISFVTLVTVVFSWIEMRFDQRSTVVFDEDGVRSESEQKIIHEYYLPIRGLVLVLIPLAADMRELLPWVCLVGFGCAMFWIVFDIFCAVVWLGKPWYYAGEPPPWGWDPLLFFFFKGAVMAAFLWGYIRTVSGSFFE